MNSKGYCLELGTEEYGQIYLLQKKLNYARREGNIPDTVLLLQHHQCFTVGRKGGFDHILVSDEQLRAEEIRVYESDRGGDVTYHGAGQLICYPIIDLKNHGSDVHLFARQMEEVLIRTLDRFGIKANRKPEYPGVWVGNAKIGAEGIAVQNWVTMHGVSLNVCPDLHHFSFIVPCGISALGVCSMQQLLNSEIDISMVRKEMRKQFSEIFDLLLEDISLNKIKEMVNYAQPA
jgi:lipoate-protein ligase B